MNVSQVWESFASKTLMERGGGPKASKCNVLWRAVAQYRVLQGLYGCTMGGGQSVVDYWSFAWPQACAPWGAHTYSRGSWRRADMHMWGRTAVQSVRVA